MQKMNLLDMQKLGIENGELTESDIVAFDKNTAVLPFTRHADVLTSEHNGKKVYPMTENNLTEGVWICRLVPSGPFFRAKGLKKLDASFFMELKQSQKQIIIDALWESSRDIILGYMPSKVSEETDAKVESAVTEAIRPLQEEIEQLKADISEKANELEKKRILIDSLQSRPPETVVVHDTELMTMPRVTRKSEEVVHCDLFVKPLYFVHISFDKKVMTVQPHDYGRTMCLNGDLYLSNFGKLVPFTGERELRCEITDNGFKVFFD